jgi:hypothetical protein
MPYTHCWMNDLKDSRQLGELCLPGSHDAGVFEDLTAGVKPGVKARTQYSHIENQAMAGSRVFDVRVFLRTKGVINKKKIPTMGHFFKEAKDGYMGDYGGTLMAALEHAARFLTIFPSEFLIFRIGHTKCTTNVADALKQFDKAKPNIIHKGGTGNLANLTVQLLRGKLLLVFDNNFHSPSYSTADGYYPYTKYPSIPNSGGLAFCGKYSGGLGKAMSWGDKNKGNWSSEGSAKIAKDAWTEHKTHTQGDHLFWVYWQETGGNVQKQTTGQDGMHNRLGSFLLDLQTNQVMPNVIGHDFVKKSTCIQIIKMNPDLKNTNIT